MSVPGRPTPAAERPMSIEDASRLLSVPIPTIRSWERRYGIPSVERSPGGHRRYAMADLDLLRAMRDEIAKGRRAGQAAELARSRAARARTSGSEFVDAFVDAADQMDARRMHGALEAAAERLGVVATLADVVVPSMREVGSHWELGICDVANEHLATGTARAWIASVTPPPRAGRAGKTAVLAAGPQDAHTIGLEVFAALLARSGWSCRTLGQLTPAASLTTAVRTSGARITVVTSHLASTRRAAIEAIRHVSRVRGTRVFYAGNAFLSATAQRRVPGTYLGDDLRAAARLVEATARSRLSPRQRGSRRPPVTTSPRG